MGRGRGCSLSSETSLGDIGSRREGDDWCWIRCHEELYAFMNGHKRNDVFMQAQGDGRAMQLIRVPTTRWNSTEAAVKTVFCKFDAVLGAVEQQLSHCTGDSQTVTSAIGLRKRLRDIRVILCMNILKIIYRITGPASRMLQGASIDLASAAAVLNDCRKQFEDLRSNADLHWEALLQETLNFAQRT